MPVLVIGIGNPSRGDDAIGPLAIERLETMALAGVELLTTSSCRSSTRWIWWAAASGVRRCHRRRGGSVLARAVAPAADLSATTHALAPAAVLDVYRQYTMPPAVARVLAVRASSSSSARRSAMRRRGTSTRRSRCSLRTWQGAETMPALLTLADGSPSSSAGLRRAATRVSWRRLDPAKPPWS